ncbi:MAG: acyl carrier protein [Acidobacteriota bacterium]|nr:acyl carrier protein [Acidobacteriota bacterium]
MATVHRRVQRVFREIFDDDAMEVNDETSAKSVPEWDSLAHVRLIIALEEEFDIKFTTREVVQMGCLGDLKKAIVSKGAAD